MSGICKFDGLSWEKYYPGKGFISNSEIEKDREKWLDSLVNGKIIFENVLGDRNNIRAGFAYEDIISVAADEAGTIWFGTWGKGVICYDRFKESTKNGCFIT